MGKRPPPLPPLSCGKETHTRRASGRVGAGNIAHFLIGWVSSWLTLLWTSPFYLLFSLFLGDDMREMQLSPGVGSPPGPPGDLEDDEGLKHLQQV